MISAITIIDNFIFTVISMLRALPSCSHFMTTAKPHAGKGKAKSPSFREHDVTNLCVVLYLHAAQEYNLISAPLTGYGTETMRRRRKQFLARNVLVNY